MSKPIVLLVDDDKTMLNSLMDQLRNAYKSEFSFEAVQSISEAREFIASVHKKTGTIKLIISDWLMPPERANTFLEEVHNNHPEIALILLSGYADDEAIKNAFDTAKIRAFIRKPWEEEELIDAVRNNV